MIQAPIVSEKSTMLAEQQKKFVFKVQKKANKKIIKEAAKFESAKSLNGPMKFLKGNVGKINNNGNTGMDKVRRQGSKRGA